MGCMGNLHMVVYMIEKRRETFWEFLDRNSHYKPVMHEEMSNVYRKQHEAFIAYVDEQVKLKLAEIEERFELLKFYAPSQPKTE